MPMPQGWRNDPPCSDEGVHAFDVAFAVVLHRLYQLLAPYPPRKRHRCRSSCAALELALHLGLAVVGLVLVEIVAVQDAAP
jgi:hypothetical protein